MDFSDVLESRKRNGEPLCQPEGQIKKTKKNTPQGVWWILTIPHHEFTPWLPPSVKYIKGQLERGESLGFLHWQIVCCFQSKLRLGGVRLLFGSVHAELTRSAAAREYVWKDDTAVVGTRFELGAIPFDRSSSRDWDAIRDMAINGSYSTIDSSVFIQYYNSLRRIHADFGTAAAIERVVYVFVGPTGTGKSRRAWNEAGLDAYPKSPTTKFWDGYTGQSNVVIDEFRGAIEISHLLRWFDRYPVLVEIKGSSVPLRAQSIWVTSNLSVDQWYPGVDEVTMNALKRRLKVTNFVEFFKK